MHSKEHLDNELKTSLLAIADCQQAIADHPASALSVLKKAVTEGQQHLQQYFREHLDAFQIVYGRSLFVDAIIQQVAAIKFADHLEQLGIVAVGGYGRGELHPHSDVDLMIMLPNDHEGKFDSDIEQFLMLLWDIKLEIGHSVRTLDECIEEATNDITVITNITESRLLCGSSSLFDAMSEATSTDKIWDSKRFFEHKLEEQNARHIKFESSAFKLEPNIKECHGGLRDIQMIGWVAKRHFGATRLSELLDHGFLTEEEYTTLKDGEALIWNIRASLHYKVGRREDRLLFDFQRDIALEYNYEDGPNNQAIEGFMQNYYRTVMELERLNEMLLQLFKEAILYPDEITEPQILNTRFETIHGYINVRNENVFSETPNALLEIFLLLELNPDIVGVRAETIRLIREHRHLIDENFRQSAEAKELFIRIISAPEGVTHELRRMNRYGILAAYIPAFEKIVGRMQYDLFHAYTVDEHTLSVVRNLRRFSAAEFLHEYPLCSAVFTHLPKAELLYLAGLFHDIAKGRGGDHSELGAVDALDFCLQHGLPKEDAQLVSWLVKNHLIMSVTAQRKDISDPDVVNKFASQMDNQVNLDYLYLLTVADIRGTNPTTWNSWKDSLLAELYNKTSVVLRLGKQTALSIEKSILQSQRSSLNILAQEKYTPEQIEPIWASFSDEYFLRFTPDQIARHMLMVLKSDNDSEEELPIIEVEPQNDKGTIEIAIYMKNKDGLFAQTASALGQLGLNIVDANIVVTDKDEQFTLHLYQALNDYADTGSLAYHLEEIIENLRTILNSDTQPEQLNIHTPRLQKHFDVPTDISFSEDSSNNRTLITISSSDTAGLLQQISRAFVDSNIRVHNAKIATMGEKAEDLFYITDKNNQPISDQTQQQKLREKLISYLD